MLVSVVLSLIWCVMILVLVLNCVLSMCSVKFRLLVVFVLGRLWLWWLSVVLSRLVKWLSVVLRVVICVVVIFFCGLNMVVVLWVFVSGLLMLDMLMNFVFFRCVLSFDVLMCVMLVSCDGMGLIGWLFVLKYCRLRFVSSLVFVLLVLLLLSVMKKWCMLLLSSVWIVLFILCVLCVLIGMFMLIGLVMLMILVVLMIVVCILIILIVVLCVVSDVLVICSVCCVLLFVSIVLSVFLLLLVIG